MPVPVAAELVASVNDLLDEPFPPLGDLRVEEEGCPDPQLVKEVEQPRKALVNTPEGVQ
jgi:hypothetical protein